MDSNIYQSNPNNSLVEILTKNEEMENNKASRQKKIEQSSLNLHRLGSVQKEISQKIKLEFDRIKDFREQEMCTFKPSLISLKKKMDSEVLKLGFVERRDHIKQKFNEK
jgi:hypothetical protein